ncbi:MAG: histidine--tRNA ligase [Myxococcota bacterium]
METVNLARGTRDFLPAEAAARRTVIERLRGVFARHGFEGLETPAFERIETLTGKYGDEGQKLIYRILKRGEGAERGEVDLALRYDLTVPLARVVTMNPSLRMPFKRWQIAPVWRADRPAKGRYREFWQCDCDVVGSGDALADAECLAVAGDAFRELGFVRYTIRVYDRRLLRATARACGVGEDREVGLFVAVDKLDKIGRDGVDAELASRGHTEAERARLWEILGVTGDREAVFAGLIERLAGQDEVEAAIAGLREVVALAEALGVPEGVIRIDPTLARGLDYYTGPVWEIEVEEPKVGTLAAGGRYDRLMGIFGRAAVPAVGISFGLERILTVMEEQGMLPPRIDVPDVLVTVFDAENRHGAAVVAAALRAGGLRVDLYAGVAKLKAQLKYADALGATWVAIVGPGEVKRGVVALKNLRTGDQLEIPLAGAVDRIRTGLAQVTQPS